MYTIYVAQPIYLDVYFDLVSKISQGYYSERNPLPSERTLCSIYHVSRSTIRRTMNILRNDTYIKTIHGSGNYVEPRLYHEPLTDFHSFSNTFKANGLFFSSEVVNYELIDYDYYLRNIIPDCADCKWHKLINLSKDKSSELMIEISYLPQDRFYNIDTTFLKDNSLYEYLKSFYNINIDRAQEFLSSILPMQDEAELLRITTKSPCTMLERICYEKGKIILLQRTIVRGDKFKFKYVFEKTNKE